MKLLRFIFTDGRVQLSVLILGLILYIALPLSLKPLMGLLVGTYIVLSLFLDFYFSSSERGFYEEVKEWLKIIVVLLLFFVTLRLLLHTETPISAVVSCSMVPQLNRGDLIIVSGKLPHAMYNISVDNRTFNALFSPSVDVFVDGEAIGKINGSLFSYCASHSSSICKEFYSHPSKFYERKGKLSFIYGMCSRNINGASVHVPCISALAYNGTVYPLYPLKGDIIVYRLNSKYLFGKLGDVVHRALFSIRCCSKVVYLTKGDNNNVFDIQFYSNLFFNTPPSSEELLGTVIFRIPYLGYYKLFITPYLKESPLCSSPLNPPRH